MTAEGAKGAAHRFVRAAALGKARGHIEVGVFCEYAKGVSGVMLECGWGWGAAHTAAKRCARVVAVAESSSRNVEACAVCRCDGGGVITMLTKHLLLCF